MILDKVCNLEKYCSIHPLFKQVVQFINDNNLAELEHQQIVINDKLYANVDLVEPKEKKEALLEAHQKYIDIQIPLTHSEVMGHSPLCNSFSPLKPYDSEKDIIFYEDKPLNYFTVEPNMFAIFFPEDAHAPAISTCKAKKIVFKIKC